MAANGQLTVAAILVAGGRGVRLGAQVPKALASVAGRTLVEHACARFAGHPGIRDVLVIAPASHRDAVAELLPDVHVLPGGVLRADSVCVGLDHLADDVTAVLVHDVARPFVPADVISRVVAALAAGSVGAIPVVAISDTVKRVAGGAVTATVPREALRAAQTPQGFTRSVLADAYARARADGFFDVVTDDASVVEAAGHQVVVVDGSHRSLKITTPWDLRVAELLATDADADAVRR
jgi:2-C-methyl-D-erythritol 4-phosphate cytidylyltransferase